MMTTSSADSNMEQLNSYKFLVGMKNGIAILENSLTVSYRVIQTDLPMQLLGICL